MFSSLCRRQILQNLGWTSRASFLPATVISRTHARAFSSGFRSLYRGPYGSWQSPKMASGLSKFRHGSIPARRAVSTAPDGEAPQAVAEEDIDPDLSPEEMEMIMERVREVWPRPERDPAGWSSDWEAWPYLLTYYWLSPYYLRLPQVDMIVNIQFHVEGETRPILYSTNCRVFIFSIVEDPETFLLLDGEGGHLLLFDDIHTEQALLDLLETDPDAIMTKLVPLEPHPEGTAALKRIFERDESVIDLLEKEFLTYRPVATTPEQEGVEPARAELSEEEEVALFKDMRKDVKEWNERYPAAEEDVKEIEEDVLRGPIPIGQMLETLDQFNEIPEEAVEAAIREQQGKGGVVQDEVLDLTEEEAAKAEKALEEETERIVKDSKGKFA